MPYSAPLLLKELPHMREGCKQEAFSCQGYFHCKQAQNYPHYPDPHGDINMQPS